MPFWRGGNTLGQESRYSSNTHLERIPLGLRSNVTEPSASSRDPMSEDTIDTATVMRLLELGRCADIDTPATLDRFKDLETRSGPRGGGDYWETAAQSLDTADLVALVKGLTVADEHLLGWSAGSVA